MYLCFEYEDKRSAYPESSLINFDENGFTVRSMIGRGGKDMVFLNIDSYKGTVQSFEQALKYVRRATSKSRGGEAPRQTPKTPTAKLPESPSF